MWVFLLIFFIIILLIGYKQIRFLIKRFSLLFKLKKANAKVIGTRRLWFLGTKRGKSCDFYIETTKEILSIKLFDCGDRSSILVFTDNLHYFFRKHAIFVSMSPGSLKIPVDGRHKTRPNYDFNYRFHAEWKTKTIKNILLVHPVCREIIWKPEHGDEIPLGSGDLVNNMTVMSLLSLIKYIDSAA